MGKRTDKCWSNTTLTAKNYFTPSTTTINTTNQKKKNFVLGIMALAGGRWCCCCGGGSLNYEAVAIWIYSNIPINISRSNFLSSIFGVKTNIFYDGYRMKRLKNFSWMEEHFRFKIFLRQKFSFCWGITSVGRGKLWNAQFLKIVFPLRTTVVFWTRNGLLFRLNLLSGLYSILNSVDWSVNQNELQTRLNWVLNRAVVCT